MSLADAPQWLVSAFVRSTVAVGATAPREQIQRTARELVERWQEPERRFHNLRHLIDVLARVNELAEETHVPDVVRLAAWYHGAVFNSSAQVAYARRGGEDEVASAALAGEQLAALGVPDAVTERVQELVRALARHDADEHDVDALALCDADLGTLAVEPQRYAAYRRAIREEYAHIPEPDYVASRLTILTRLLQRRRLFVSPFSLSWEEPARENLTAELSHLRARLAELGGTEQPAEECSPRHGSATSWPSRGTATSAPRPAASGPGEAATGRRDAPATPPAPPAQVPVTAAAPEATPAPAVTPDEPDLPEDGEPVLSGIERDPEFELRRRIRRKRRERAAAQLPDEAAPSPSALFRPPPKPPRS
ncbi:HD domain-containing protein [Georgenia sp. Marseille-Q6866]